MIEAQQPTQRAAEQPVCIDAHGAWPFTTHRTLMMPDGSAASWQSRRHRKGFPLLRAAAARPLARNLLRCLYLPSILNWWVGIVFALGAALFMLGSLLSLSPQLALRWGIEAHYLGAIFFAGSIPFSTAAYLQLYQAANASPVPGAAPTPVVSKKLFGWQPANVGWLACALQFMGTLLFNINTFDAMQPGLDWQQQDWLVWAPDFAGSVLFLASGYLVFVETCHTHWAFKPRSMEWWIVFINLMGCIAFMVSALYAFIPSHGASNYAITAANAFTLIGAACFFVGALLLLPESLQGIENHSARAKA